MNYSFRNMIRPAIPWLVMIALFALGAVASAQIQVTAQAPPGTLSTDVATVIGWVRYVFGVLAVLLIVIGLFSVMKHPATGVMELLAAIICIIAAGNAQGIVTAIYHGGTG